MIPWTFRGLTDWILTLTQKLQRAIAEYRGLTNDRPLNAPRQDAYLQETSGVEDQVQQSVNERGSLSTNKEQKRRYRRHPKPDEHAPEKPASAYVLFSNKIRDEVKSQNLSFTEIARLVGEKWQKLDPEEKSIFETRAAANKDEYNKLLADYKKTTVYKDYMEYLADFKAKHGGQDASGDSKRPRLHLSNDDSGQSFEDDQTDGSPDTYQTLSQHDRNGSISSGNANSRSGSQLTSVLQIATSLPGLRPEYNSGGSPFPKSLHGPRNRSRTPIQSYATKRDGADSMDVESPSFNMARRHDSPSTETSTSGYSLTQERLTEGEFAQPSRPNPSQFNAYGFPISKGAGVSPERSFPPMEAGGQRSSFWEGYGTEGPRQAYNVGPAPIKTSPPPARPPDIKFSPISQILDPKLDFGPRTLPPIHKLSTSPAYPSSPPGPILPASDPGSKQPLPIPSSETMAFRPGFRNEQSLNVTINTGAGEVSSTADGGTLPILKQPPSPTTHRTQIANPSNVSGRESNRYR